MAQKRAPSPPHAAMTRLNEIMARGADAHRVSRECDAIVARLRERGEAEEVRSWLEELRDGCAESAEAAREAIDDIETSEKAARRHAETAVQALVAAGQAFGRHIEAPYPT